MPEIRLARARRGYEHYVYQPPQAEGFQLPTVPPIVREKCLCSPQAPGFVCVYCQARQVCA